MLLEQTHQERAMRVMRDRQEAIDFLKTAPVGSVRFMAFYDEVDSRRTRIDHHKHLQHMLTEGKSKPKHEQERLDLVRQRLLLEDELTRGRIKGREAEIQGYWAAQRLVRRLAIVNDVEENISYLEAVIEGALEQTR